VIAWIAAALGLVLAVGGAWADPRHAAFQWLVAFGWGANLVLGAVALALLARVAPIRWMEALLPSVRALAANTVLLLPLFLPVMLAVAIVYPWATPRDLPEATRRIVEGRGIWQTPGFFLLRSVGYFAAWIGVTTLTARWDRARTFAGLGLVLLGVTWTLAAFDWFMSLEPRWTSTIYGMYTFTGGVGAALAATVLLARADESAGRVPRLPPDVYHALGRLLFAFVVLWAYLFWAQLLIVWIGGIPEEAAHLEVRLAGWPGWLGALLGVHFVLPFLLLLGRAPKRWGTFLAGVSLLVLVGHLLDMAWLVLPALQPGGPRLSPWDGGPILVVAGVLTGATRQRLGPVPAEDLAPTLGYRSP
jgi:hypothetical protein